LSVGGFQLLVSFLGSKITTQMGSDNLLRSALQATVAGGLSNDASGERSAIGGGAGNSATNIYTTVGGGQQNEASDFGATVAGGTKNVATGGNRPAIGGGSNNEANASHATVPGGIDNTASGDYSVAMGRNATASNDGAFVVGDSTNTEVSSSAADEARFQGDIVSESSIETALSYSYSGSSLFTESFENSDSNDAWAVSASSQYVATKLLTVEDTGDVTVNNSLEVNNDGTEQRASGPIAKGYVNSDGSLESGVNITNSEWNSSKNWYAVNVENTDSGAFGDYVIHATPSEEAIAVRGFPTGGGGFSFQFGDDAQHAFQFTIYQNPAGSS